MNPVYYIKHVGINYSYFHFMVLIVAAVFLYFILRDELKMKEAKAKKKLIWVVIIITLLSIFVGGLWEGLSNCFFAGGPDSPLAKYYFPNIESYCSPSIKDIIILGPLSGAIIMAIGTFIFLFFWKKKNTVPEIEIDEDFEVDKIVLDIKNNLKGGDK